MGYQEQLRQILSREEPKTPWRPTRRELVWEGALAGIGLLLWPKEALAQRPPALIVVIGGKIWAVNDQGWTDLTQTLNVYGHEVAAGGGIIACTGRKKTTEDLNDIYLGYPDGSGFWNLTQTLNVSECSPALSPDGSVVAFSVSVKDPKWPQGWREQIYAMRTDGTGRKNLTNSLYSDTKPTWSPDGIQIAFLRSVRRGVGGIYVMDNDGRNQRKLTDDQDIGIPNVNNTDNLAWSPDGNSIAFEICGNFGNFAENSNIAILDLRTKKVSQLTSGSYECMHPTFTPWGQIIYIGERPFENHQFGIYIMNPDGSGEAPLSGSIPGLGKVVFLS